MSERAFLAEHWHHCVGMSEYCLTQWNVFYPSSEREFGLVCKLKYCFEKFVASNYRKSFQSISLVHCWQSSWKQTCLASLSGPCSGFCDRAQSRRIVPWQRSKRALNVWGLCLNGFIRHRRKERWFTCNTSKPLKAFHIFEWLRFHFPFVVELAAEIMVASQLGWLAFLFSQIYLWGLSLNEAFLSEALKLGSNLKHQNCYIFRSSFLQGHLAELSLSSLVGIQEANGPIT